MFTPAKPKLRYQLTFEGSWPTSVAFLASGRLASGNQLRQIYVWELPEKPPEFQAKPKGDRQAANVWPVRWFEGHTNEISRLVVTPDGKFLASSSFDRSIRLWPTNAPAAGKVEVVLDDDMRKCEARRTGKKEPSNSPGVSVETQTACEVLDGHK